MGLHCEAKLVRKFTEFAKLLNVYLNHFPKHERYGLAQTMRATAYEMFGLIVEAEKRYHKKTTLTQLDITHERLRMFAGLAHDLGYFGFRAGQQSEDDGSRRFLALSRHIDELGRMIGGWIRSEQREAS